MSQKSGAEKQYAKLIDYKVTFGSQQGRRVLLDLMNAHHMNEAFRGDSAELQFREGERFVILRIIKMLKMDVSRLKEAIDEEQQQQRGESR